MPTPTTLIAALWITAAGAVALGLSGCGQESPRSTTGPAIVPPGASSNDVSVAAAREALKSVGADPAADELWIRAINNPKLSPDDRTNLIEDLNEVGFANPGQPTAADLAKIKARIALIDKLAPSARDDVNKAAFAEARKDLVAMQANAKP